MKRAYNHITPLATMNWLTTLVNILEGCLKPENINNKADQVRAASLGGCAAERPWPPQHHFALPLTSLALTHAHALHPCAGAV